MPALRQLVKARGLTERITGLPWLEDLSAVYAAIDIEEFHHEHSGDRNCTPARSPLMPTLARLRALDSR